MILFSLCDIPWWLALLLPFLLGLAAGWAIWSKYKSMVEDLNAEISTLKKKISTLEGDLNTCRSRRADLEGDLSIAKGRMRELEAEMGAMKLSGGAGRSSSSSNIDVSAVASGLAGAAVGGAKSTVFDKIPNDNLQIVEGIGPKMNEVLNENGVHTWADLASKSPDDLNSILGKYGDKYRIIDPATWSAQAALARDGEWDDLVMLQKNLDTGRDTNISETDSKIEKMLVKLGLLKKYKQDDLKAVEGIGPKISGLLNNDGINTWRELANSSVERIQGILDTAGSRYKLADPKTWPKQAGMAADGKWKELSEYQDFLKGGKE
jgi:predicted flap endonuclease-1-like 5' DNA nuclease